MNMTDLLAYPGVALSLLRLVTRPTTLSQARAVIRERLQRRGEMFLYMLRSRIFGYPKSPYLPLLSLAGCEYGDIETMVRQQGIEATLEALRQGGIYFSFEEFRGHTEVARRGRIFRFSATDFDNPVRGAAVEIRTGGTRSAGVPVALHFDFLAEQRAPSYHVMLEALGAAEGPVVVWHQGYPSGAGVAAWLTLPKMGRPPLHWYSMSDPNRPGIAARHRMIVRTAVFLSRLAGLPLPMPEFTPIDRPELVADGIGRVLRQHGKCAIITTPSAAVRLAAVAGARGQSLEGLAIIVGAEPLTPGKHTEICASGARVGAQYVFSEGGAVGGLCGDPEAVDETHFQADCYAMILNRRELAGAGPVDAFMFTSLLPSAPKIMLNVESDDFGVVTTRRCNCVWDELGLHEHLHTIRSFTKLTGEGVTVLGTDCVRILEEVLPREFGGRSIDYQLLEIEDADHLTRLYLVINPSVGPVDEQKALARFVEELRDPTRPRRMGIPPLWQQADSIRVVRREPVLTARGKLLPFHTQAAALFQPIAAETRERAG